MADLMRLDYVYSLDVAVPAVVDLTRQQPPCTIAALLAPRALKKERARLNIGQLLLVRAAEGSMWVEVYGEDDDGYLTIRPLLVPTDVAGSAGTVVAGEAARRRAA